MDMGSTRGGRAGDPGQVKRALVVLPLLAAGCNVALRSSDGGAFARPAAGEAQIRSLYVGDRGGLFSRLGLGALGGLAAMGTVDNVNSSTTATPIYDGSGNRVGTETTTITSGTVNADRAAALQRTGDQATATMDDQLRGGAIDPTQNYGSVTGGLEIASTKLGGDTSGWMFDFGVKGGQRYGAWGYRAALKIGLGKYTFHERERDGVMHPESTYKFFGFPLRLGITYHGVVEVFGQLDLNLVTAFTESLPEEFDSSPSPWRTGVRVTIARYVYAEAGIAFSAMRSAKTSTMLEAGIEF